MKPAGILGIILIIVGIVALAYGGYASFTTKENVAKLGPLEINKHEEHPVPIGPIAAVARTTAAARTMRFIR